MEYLKIKWFYTLLLLVGLALTCSPQQVNAQSKAVTGTVVGTDGTPMIGATVMVKGNTKSGTITDFDGKFSIKAGAKDVLVFSFIGYDKVEVKVSALGTKPIVMKENQGQLGEVVVVGYGTQKKETMTGSISQIKSAEISKSPVANMGQALTGRAAGVTTYQRSGEPGDDDVTIRIRGTGTLNSSSPLVLVDGVERDFTQIDPNEVESMSILKDAASTAVFGIRGANGVIIVTTKKGKEGPAKVAVSGNFALQQPIRMPESTDAATTARMYNEAKYNDDPTQAPTFSAEDIALYENGQDPLAHHNINWKDYLLKKSSFQQRYNVSISGGTKDTKYYTSISFFNQDGIMKDVSSQVDGLLYKHNYNYSRVNIRSNLDVNLTPTTTLGVQLGGIITSKAGPSDSFSEILQAAAMAGPFIYDRKLVAIQNIPFGKSGLEVLLGKMNYTRTNTINTSINFKQKLDFITKGLLFRMLASYDSYYSHNLIKGENENLYYLQDGYDADGNPTKVFQQAWEASGVAPTPTDSWARTQSMHAEGALEYKNGFGDHNMTALVLGTLDKKWWTMTQYPTVPVSYMGIVSRLTYDYASRYLLEFNMGYNGSENFAEGKRFAWFPAVSLGWNVTEEPFMKKLVNPDILTKLKLRASYGLVGNDNTGGRRFMYLSGAYTSATGMMLGSSTHTTMSGYAEGKLGNPDVTWETAAKQNYGIDLGLFNDALTFTAEFFFEDRKDILATRYTEPAHLAISGQDVYNIGRVKNKGFELEGRYNGRINRDLSFFVSGNYSYAHNNIIEDGSIKDPNNPQLWTVGHPVGTHYGYKFVKFYESQEEIDKGPNLGNPTIGDAKYADLNGDGIINSDDQQAFGYPEIPEINYGFSFGGEYKGFGLSVLFQGAAHSTKVLSGIFRKPFSSNEGIPSFCIDERWTPETASTAIRPKLTLAYTSMSYENSDLWARDGSYLKLRNVEISYTFNSKQIRRILPSLIVNTIRVYVNGQNLYTWDKLKFVDPESTTSDSYAYPQLRIFNAGFSFNF
jgi:TonB-linked SusC/RagA family outer membrane protein